MKRIVFNGLVIFLLLSCNNNYKIGEQYKKVISIVHSFNEVYSPEIKISDEVQEDNISVYISGSEKSGEDVHVVIDIADSIITKYDSINYNKYTWNDRLRILPESCYEIPSHTVTIKKGEEFGVLPIYLRTDVIDVDSNYAIPITIVSTDKYEINEERNTIIFQINLVNDYSAYYVGILNRYEDGHLIQLSKNKHLKAITENSVRTTIYNFSDDERYAETNLMELEILSDNSVKIKKYRNSYIEDLGNSTYDPDKKVFHLHYKCMTEEGEYFDIDEILTDSEQDEKNKKEEEEGFED